MISNSQLVPRSLLIFTYFIIASIVLLSSICARAATITVPASGSLQSALNAAQPGDTIVLEAGATYTGDFVLPNTVAVRNKNGNITFSSQCGSKTIPVIVP